MSVTREAWLDAVTAVTALPLPVEEGAITIAEFAQLLGVSRNPASTRMAALVKAGKARHTRKWVLRTDGRRTQVPAYVLVKEAPDVRHALARSKNTRRARRGRRATRS